MTGNHFKRLSIAMAMPILCVATGIGCEGTRTGLLVRTDAAVFMGAGGSAGPAATGAGGSVGPAATGAGGASTAGSKTGAGGTSMAGGKTSAGGTAGGASGAAGGASVARTTSVSMGGNSTVSSGRDAGVGGHTGTGGMTMASAPVIADSGYVKVSAGTVVMTGFIVSSTAGSGSSISLTYGTSNFCASGTVAANSTYKSWANAGFTVNQDPSGASGSSSSLVLSGSTISVGYVNKGGSDLQFQFYDGSNYWCYILPPSSAPTTTTIPFASLNTQCWNGMGSPFTSGTAISSVSLVVPGSNATPTPFDFCFLGLTVN